ncbi:MAG: GNAT family N-acetyltransferase [Bacillota bacterium]|nr:GNAT family N-acetyltransferase [Bacillota bacterium]
MVTKIITSTEEFYNLKGDWEYLQENDEDVTYYSTFEYNWVWWNVFKNDESNSLFIIALENEGKIVGIAPLYIEKVKIKFLSYRKISFIGQGDYFGVIFDKNCNVKSQTILREFFKVMEENNGMFDRILLTNIKHDSQLSSWILRSIRYNKYFKHLSECPILNYKKYSNFDEYKKKFVSTSAKKFINKLQREVGYNFKVVSNDVYDVYDKIVNMHKEEQNHLVVNKGRTERSSLFNTKFGDEFIRNLYKTNSKVITFVLEDKDGKLLMYDTCYLYKKVLHSWNMAYDPKFENYNLGKVINLEIVMYNYENNLFDIFDFGTGRYPWKFEWTDDFVIDYNLDVWNENTKMGKIFNKVFNITKRVLNK